MSQLAFPINSLWSSCSLRNDLIRKLRANLDQAGVRISDERGATRPVSVSELARRIPAECAVAEATHPTPPG